MKQFLFLRETYSYDGLIKFIMDSIPSCNSELKFITYGRHFVDREYPYHDFPEFIDFDMDKCIEKLSVFIMFYKHDRETARNTDKNIRNTTSHGSSIVRLLLRIAHLKYPNNNI